ncbi:uncharacterized protein A4U43_UnF8030 [Asparagus officinalis]|uniref:Uncharacterized protein n=1 Tax=Asparagus officinalis TaxID=4686 RepID=A0A1R3L629_ASPOF|nr:uncharacterized protein A4U43_UnF8030 [Asparagus officinalis]
MRPDTKFLELLLSAQIAMFLWNWRNKDISEDGHLRHDSPLPPIWKLVTESKKTLEYTPGDPKPSPIPADENPKKRGTRKQQQVKTTKHQQKPSSSSSSTSAKPSPIATSKSKAPSASPPSSPRRRHEIHPPRGGPPPSLLRLLRRRHHRLQRLPGGSDPDSIAAIASLLSVLIGDSFALPPPKAKDAAFLLSEFLLRTSGTDPDSSLATGTVRSLIKSLGVLSLLVDLEDWTSVELPLQMLLSYAVDKRPKVRKCAQTCIENLFKAFRSSVVIKNGSKAVHSMYQKHTPLLEKSGSKIQSESEQLEALHMFNVVTVIVPSLSEKVRIRLLSSASKLLGHSFSSRTRHILKLLEALVEWTEIEHLASDSEKVLSALTSYISTDKNPIDTIISASMLLKNGLKKLHDAQPSLWIKFLPPIFSSIAGYLNSDATTSKCAENILKELINTHINRKLLLSTGSPLRDYDEDTPEMMAVTSICTLFDQMLGACDTPTENILAVISVLFLALGEFSFFLMKGIFLKLSKKAMHLKEESPHMKHVEACIGTAIIAMGPEKVLSLVPISLDTDKATCSNTWILPVLKRYVIGASLQYFMECVVPLAESVQNACKKVKKTSKLKGLQSCFHGLMDLLPAFCRYPTDTSKSFSDLSKLLIAMLKESQSLHATVASAVKELVNGNRSFIKPNEGAKPSADLRSALELSKREARDLFNCYSEKTASRNIKALACSSMELFWVLTDIFWDSPPDKHFLKEAIGCLASVLGREKIKDFFVSSLEKCEAGDDLLETRKLEDILEVDINGGIENASKKKGFKNRSHCRCLIMELASSFVETADEDLINIIFSFIKSNLLDTDGTCHIEAYYALNRILEVHSWFFEIRVDELMDLLFSVKISADSDAIKNRFLCLHYLLVHILQKNDKNVDNKAFLILNEIIITLKTKKESRKLAYNVLLNISCTLKETQDTDPESGLQKLLNMELDVLPFELKVRFVRVDSSADVEGAPAAALWLRRTTSYIVEKHNMSSSVKKGTGVTNALIRTRKAVDKDYDGEADEVPILSTSVAYGVYMAVSSNLRYQILAGIIEQRILEPLLHNHKLMLSALCFAVRTGNTFVGSLLWVDYARLVGIQKVRE